MYSKLYVQAFTIAAHILSTPDTEQSNCKEMHVRNSRNVIAF
jgi:hypothetical protein